MATVDAVVLQEIISLQKDPRTQFALDLLDPQLYGAVLTVPEAFLQTSGYAGDARHFWGIVDGIVTIGLGVHHGVNRPALWKAVRDYVECFPRHETDNIDDIESRRSTLKYHLQKLGVDESTLDQLFKFIESNKLAVSSASTKATVTTIRSDPLKLLAGVMPVRHYLGSVEVCIYNMALKHLRQTLFSLVSLGQLSSSSTQMINYIFQVFKNDERWKQIHCWVKIRTNIAGSETTFLAQPLSGFFGIPFEGAPLSAIQNIKREIWKETPAYGQFALLEIHSVDERVREGKSNLDFPWASPAMDKMQKAFACRKIANV